MMADYSATNKKEKAAKLARIKANKRQSEYKKRQKGKDADARYQAGRRAAQSRINPATGKPYVLSAKSYNRDRQRLIEHKAAEPAAVKQRQIRVENAVKRKEETGSSKPVKVNPNRGQKGLRIEQGHVTNPLKNKTNPGLHNEAAIKAQSKEPNRLQGNKSFSEIKKAGQAGPADRPWEIKKTPVPNYQTKELAAARKRAAARKAATAAGAPASKTQMTPQGRIK